MTHEPRTIGESGLSTFSTTTPAEPAATYACPDETATSFAPPVELDQLPRHGALERRGYRGVGELFLGDLQQIAQRDHGLTPLYELLDEKGPDHSKCFKIAAQVGPTRFQAAWGRNKKEAEQRAALNALSQIQGDEPPYPSD